MNKKELKEMLRKDKWNNIGNRKLYHLFFIIATRHASWLRWKYIKYMRLSCYYEEKFRNKKLIYAFPMYINMLKMNNLGYKLNFEIGGKHIGEGLSLCHNGPIVIHGASIIGKNCVLHGDNCIGNDGISNDCPVLGDNVDVGVGAKIIGNVTIANGVRIGAGAVVVKDFTEENITIGGIPAKRIK
ncbi:poly-gamma-glutamate biosynthesis protein [Ruminococcus flavefaciens]|uniref:Serine O-acetyltransferase n=1 Tax=Ruminococcus flavefaciens TaxID=1265 RepID=A0A315Y369_RUMFL|nr:poly-gamma-glutamate biosynthesis protein [Ruminococcus flavefaciens]PWJ14690.1 serine O-acetyltransferase [Ruminococcus flavefaciens]SSA42720.1 serine O-acetyltransferase [Ruminococcus flavefaciens]